MANDINTQKIIKSAKFLYSAPKTSLMKSLNDEWAFVGRSNVGKSSFINSILGQKLAKSSKTPGATKHAVCFLVELLNNEPICLIDLPGFGFAKMSKSELVECEDLLFDYISSRAELKKLFILLDIRRKIDERELLMMKKAFDREIKVMIVLTKADKLNKTQINQKLTQIQNELPIKKEQIIIHSTLKKDLSLDAKKAVFDS